MKRIIVQGELSVWNPHWYCALCTARPNSDVLQPWVQPKHFCLKHFAFAVFPDRGAASPKTLVLHSSVWKGRDESTDASVCPHQTLTPPLPQSVLPLAPVPVQVPCSDFSNISHFFVQLTCLSSLSPHLKTCPHVPCSPWLYLLGLLLLDSLTLLLSSLKLDSFFLFFLFSIWAEKRNCYFSSTSTFLILVSIPWWESLFITEDWYELIISRIFFEKKFRNNLPVLVVEMRKIWTILTGLYALYRLWCEGKNPSKTRWNMFAKHRVVEVAKRKTGADY